MGIINTTQVETLLLVKCLVFAVNKEQIVVWFQCGWCLVKGFILPSEMDEYEVAKL